MKLYGLNRKFRMLEHNCYSALRQEPSVYRKGPLIIFYKANKFSYHRLGITIKGRCTSVERSRLKRQIREWFRCLPMKGPPRVTYDMNLFIDLSRHRVSIESGLSDYLVQSAGIFDQ